MKTMKAKICAKLRAGRGETLAEVLVALLIAALALTMLASVIAASSRMITQSKAKMKTYYEANDALAEQDVDNSNASFSVTILRVDSETGADTTDAITLEPGKTLAVAGFKNDTLGSKVIYSYCLTEGEGT